MLSQLFPFLQAKLNLPQPCVTDNIATFIAALITSTLRWINEVNCF